MPHRSLFAGVQNTLKLLDNVYNAVVVFAIRMFTFISDSTVSVAVEPR